jgi:hypothetical protein
MSFDPILALVAPKQRGKPRPKHRAPRPLLAGPLAGLLVPGKLYYRTTAEGLCRVYNSADIALASATPTALTFDSISFDTQQMHDVVRSPSRITIPASVAGYYLIGACVQWAASAIGIRQIQIRLNGATILASDTRDNVAVGTSPEHAVQTVYRLNAGDYLEVVAQQTSGGSLAVKSVGVFSPCFWVSIQSRL